MKWALLILAVGFWSAVAVLCLALLLLGAIGAVARAVGRRT